ncbi:TetR/AcrR family transcriptional regulator [Nannocystaceae bacterium ST9]
MREKRREATIERIVETALHLLETEGYEGLTIQRLAKELGYAVGALYRYFRSKDALLVALLHRVMDRIGEDMQAGLAIVKQREQASASDPSVRGPISRDEALLRLLVCALAYVELAKRRQSEFGLISTLIGDPREFLKTDAAAPLVPMLIRLQLLLAAAIEDAVRAGALAPGESRDRAVILWAGVQGVSQLRKLGRFGVAGVELDRLVPITLETLLLGWGAERAHLDRIMPEAQAIARELAQPRRRPSAEPTMALEALPNQEDDDHDE